MNLWCGYHKRLMAGLNCPDLSLGEKMLVMTVLGMLAISAISQLNVADVGSLDQVRMARLQAEQELMALK